MICILSQSFRESSTEMVMRWLQAWGVDCVRINLHDLETVEGPLLEMRDGQFGFDWQLRGRRVRSGEIGVVWYRRWDRSRGVGLEAVDPVGESAHRDYNVFAANNYYTRERRAVSGAFFGAFDRAIWVNHPDRCSLNKLRVLQIARECGLDTPATIVTSDRAAAREFMRRHGGAIVKPAGEVGHFVANNSIHGTTTAVVPEHLLEKGGWAGGFPCVFQERLDAKYELRIFHVDGKCFATAYLFGDDGGKTIDSRIRERSTCPFALPEAIGAKLALLMSRLGLALGSIDLIRTRDGRWVFLEVNPNGQFWGDEAECLYPLHKEIALALARRLHG